MANDQEMRLKSEKHYKESLDKSHRSQKKKEKSGLGPLVFGIFAFIIIGSTLFQMIGNANSSSEILT